MKKCFLTLFLLIALIVPAKAQSATYSEEIAVRESFVKRLQQQISEWENRKAILLKIESEYQQLLAGKSLVDRKVEEIRKANQDQGRSARVFNRSYQNEKDDLTNMLELSAALGQTTISNYADLERWIATYAQERPKNKLELEKLENDLQKARDDINRAEKEIAVLKSQKTVVAGKAILEGDWILSGGSGKNNIVNVYYNTRDRHFYGTVTKSANMTCHPPGTILFSVISSPGSDTQFTGTEYGAFFDSALGKCRPLQANLRIAVTGATMNYNNGSQKLVLTRVKVEPAPTLPMRNDDDSWDLFDGF
ncbi:MAG: hypothetical protein JW902_07960 [Syntrophaceae bacterium]|nr:hypothetical protein [Syntrophaceae bacterium]